MGETLGVTFYVPEKKAMKYVASFKEDLKFKDIRALLKMAPAEQIDFMYDRLEVVDEARRVVDLDDLPAEDGLSVVESVLQGFTTRR